MNALLGILICFIPLIIYSAFLLIKKPLTPLHFFLSLLAGLIPLFPIVLIQFFLYKLPIFSSESMFSLFMTTLICNGIIEEGFKFLGLLILPVKKYSAAQALHASITAGLALGAFEATAYMFLGTGSILLRLLTALVIHALCGGLNGIFLHQIKTQNNYSFAFFYSILIHAFHNFFAGLPGAFWYFSLVVILFAFIRLKFYIAKFYK